MSKLEKRIIELRGQFVSTYNHLHEFIPHPIIFEMCASFSNIANYDIITHKEILKRELIKPEIRLIKGERCNERILDMYNLVYENNLNGENTIIPLYDSKMAQDFVIGWYQHHDLWIKK